MNEQHVFDEIRAVGDTVIAEMLDPVNTTKSGLFIPDSAAKAPVWWKVLSVGPKVTEVKRGDRIVFTSGSRVEFEGRTIVALKPDEVLGVLPTPRDYRDPTRY